MTMAMAAITCTGMSAVQGSGLSPIEPARIGKRNSCSANPTSCGENGYDHLYAYHNRKPSLSRLSLWTSSSSSLGETTAPKLPVLGCLSGQSWLCRSHGRRYYEKLSNRISGRKNMSACRRGYPVRATPGSQSTGELTENGEDSMSNKKQGKGQLGDVMPKDTEQAYEEEETDSFVKFMFEPFPTANEEDESGWLLDTVFDEIGKIFSNADDERTKAMRNVAFWVGAAAAFGALIGVGEGWTKASEFYAGYLLEQSLSVDNLLVFVLVFNYFQVPAAYQGRVLRYGIAGAVLFRGIMILLGVTTIQRFEAVNLVFAAVLLFSSFKLLSESSEEQEDVSNNFIVKTCQRFIPVTDFYEGDHFYAMVDGVKKATPLLLTLAVIELSDVAFAVDSIPAVFGVTRDPFIVYTSNMFAIVGLRSLYTLISSSMGELRYLQTSVALVLGFIGSKMIAEYLGEHVPIATSLAVVMVTLGTGVLLSIRDKDQPKDLDWDIFPEIINDDDQDKKEKKDEQDKTTTL